MTALMACDTAPTTAPAPAITYTAAQIAECQAAEDSFSAAGWSGEDLAAEIGTADVATDRPTIEGMIKDFLRSEPAVQPPSLVAAQWTYLVGQMRLGEGIFAAPMTAAQWNADVKSLWSSIAAFDTPCSAAIAWGQTNLPH